jgi:hypothetical protein
MERSHQIISDEGLQIPLPLIEQFGFHSGAEVVVEMGEKGIWITQAAPSQTEIENRALRILLRRLGDAVTVKAHKSDRGESQDWIVQVYARGNETPLGELHYSRRGELLSDLDEVLNQIVHRASDLTP